MNTVNIYIYIYKHKTPLGADANVRHLRIHLVPHANVGSTHIQFGFPGQYIESQLAPWILSWP